MLLMGNSGVSEDGTFHIAAPYGVEDGVVFLDVCGGAWERKRQSELTESDKKRIVRCCLCSNPATSVDHHYPFCLYNNLCDECREKEQQEMSDISTRAEIAARYEDDPDWLEWNDDDPMCDWVFDAQQDIKTLLKMVEETKNPLRIVREQAKPHPAAPSEDEQTAIGAAMGEDND